MEFPDISYLCGKTFDLLYNIVGQPGHICFVLREGYFLPGPRFLLLWSYFTTGYKNVKYSVNHPPSLLWCSTGARQECPIEMSPEKMVVEYQSKGQYVTCRPTTSGSRNIEGEVSWQLQHGNRIDSAVLLVNLSKDWDIQPVCIATFRGIGPCYKPLNFTLYSRSLFSGLVHLHGWCVHFLTVAILLFNRDARPRLHHTRGQPERSGGEQAVPAAVQHHRCSSCPTPHC